MLTKSGRVARTTYDETNTAGRISRVNVRHVQSPRLALAITRPCPIMLKF